MQQHALDLWIEAMHHLPKDAAARAAAMVAKLSGIGSVATARTEASQESPYQQMACRRLSRYPTMEC